MAWATLFRVIGIPVPLERIKLLSHAFFMDDCKPFLEGQQRHKHNVMKALKRTALILFIVCTSCTQEKENQNPTKKPQLYYSKVDYTAPSEIIKHPGRLTGDEKAVFCHPYFLKLTSTEMDNLGPYVVEKEFAKLGINLTEGERFINALLFF